MTQENAFYSQKVGDIYFNMIRIGKSNFKTWNDYIHSDLKVKVGTGISATRIVFESFAAQTKKQHLWVACVSNKPLTAPDDIEGKGIEMFVTVNISEHAPFTSHMGIQRIEGEYKHPRISPLLHTFCAQICKHVYPDKKYMAFNPLLEMRMMLEDALGKTDGKLLFLDEFAESYKPDSAIFKFPGTKKERLSTKDYKGELKWFFDRDALWNGKSFKETPAFLMELIKKNSGKPLEFNPISMVAVSLEDLGKLDAKVAGGKFTLHNNGIHIVISDKLIQKTKELSDAIKANDEAKIRKIAEENPDAVSLPNASGQSAIHYAAKSECSDEVVALILSKLNGNLDDMLDSKGFSALDYALIGKQITHGAMLIKRGATKSKLAPLKDAEKAKPYVELIDQMKEGSEAQEEKVQPPEVDDSASEELHLGPDSLEFDNGSCYVTLDPAAIELLRGLC